jgi:transmembrane sensor
MFRHRIDADPIAEAAAHWLLELEEAPPQTLRDFAAWLQQSPRHVEEFLLATAVWKTFDDFDVQRRMDIQQLIAEAKHAVRPLTTAVPARPGAAAPTPRERSWRGRAAQIGAAAAVLIIATAFWVFRVGAPYEYMTSRGEQRFFKLDDGSVLYLNTQSRVEVSYSRAARVVRLIEGEAMFTVEHDAARPFRVMAGPTVIQAIGTRFNVYRTRVGTTVSVVEGVVKIAPRASSTATEVNTSAGSASTEDANDLSAGQPHSALVSAGEQARVSPAGDVVTRAVPDLAQLVAWRERRLIFRGDSLDEVAAEFNRYNSLQIRVEGSTAKGKHVTGVFSADDPRSFVLFLERDAGLTVTQSGDEIVIRER